MTNLFVNNLPATFTEAQLISVFGRFGNIRASRLMKKGHVQNSNLPFLPSGTAV